MTAEPVSTAAVPVAVTSQGLVVPTTPPPEGWTIADVDALPDRDGVRYELVDGVPHVMTPPRVGHQDALLELHLALRATVPPGLRIVQGVGVVLAEDQRPIPDLVVVRTTDRNLSNIPADQVVLAAEVVSRSSRSDDRFRKPALYAAAGIACYLRVELDPLHVVAYLLGPDGVYEEAGRAESGEILELAQPFPIAIEPASLVR